MEVLQISHNAGFFSCSTVSLRYIIDYFNENKKLPEIVNRSNQYIYYTSNNIDPIKYYFSENKDINIKYKSDIKITNQLEEDQFCNYKKLNYKKIIPFIKKYYLPNNNIIDKVIEIEKRYNLNYEELCAVYYRGTDKYTETSIASYDDFIQKAKKIKQHNPNIKFLIQTDENDFIDKFKQELLDNTIILEEVDRVDKNGLCIHFTISDDKRINHGEYYFASVLCLSKCKHIITHSGNGAMWCLLYRGNCKNVHQWLGDKWLN